jgi:ribonuclease J
MTCTRLIPLGGLGEIGMNCLALEQRDEILVIDCGVTFDHRGLGVDVIHPEFAALEGRNVVGLFVTHGHEDHIGGIPYFLRKFDVPVYGSRYALGIVRERAEKHEVLAHARLVEVAPRSATRVGSFEVEPVRVTHSIADSMALALRTDAGLMVHTGDFKFDETPPDGEAFDVARFEELSRQRVRLLLSDSTNVDAIGPTGSEQAVGDALDAIVSAAEQAVIVAVFASNVHRLHMLGEIARKHGRKIVPLGRSVTTHMRIARATHRVTGEQAGEPYLQWPSDRVWPAERAKELPRRAVLAVTTGTQGEPGAALARLARGEHPSLDAFPGDVVVLSSRVIPGNESAVMRVVADLVRRGITVHTHGSDRAVHVSGHAHREDQLRMIRLVQPRGFVPVHGTLHHLARHAQLARDLGIPEVCVLENGDVAEIEETGIRKVDRVPTGRVHVCGGRALPARVVSERARLAACGGAHVIVYLDGGRALARDIVLATYGVLDTQIDGDVLESARQEARLAITEVLQGAVELPGAAEPTDEVISAAAQRAVRRAFDQRLGFRPLTTAIVLRLGE